MNNDTTQAVGAPLERRVRPHLDWEGAPQKTEWGADMMESLIALSKDETASLYAHKSAIPLVDGALRALLEPKRIVGYMVHSGAVENAALYPTSQHAEAIDAAHRWKASITALVCAPGGPDAA